jgi:uncharacterized protein (TIGR02611 family)
VTGTGDRKADSSVSVGNSPGEKDDTDDDDMTADPRTWLRWVRERRESIRRRPGAYRIYRILIGIIGGAIVVGGLVLVPLPGPGWLIVFVGLALLATEFEWAARLERFARDRVKDWTQWLGRQSIVVRILVAVLTFGFVAGVVYGLAVITGVPGWVPDSWVPSLPGIN